MKYSYTFLGLAALASANDFTSIYNVTATPYEVINNAGQSAPGPYGAKGQYNYAINSKTDTICYVCTNASLYPSVFEVSCPEHVSGFQPYLIKALR